MDRTERPLWKVVLVLPTLLVGVHAAAALLAAVAGGSALHRPRWAGPFVVLVVVSLLGLAGAVAVRWPELDTATRVIDLALLVLFVVVVVRAELARRVAPARRRHSARFLAGVGFGLISLADGFVVVAVFDLGAPGWALVGCGLAVAGVGHLLLTRLLRRRVPTGARAAARTDQEAITAVG